ncbi:uncharacterized protein LOC132936738 [Metopolophium dirhodum]|uniref:uncharacterized protein LOC132936738 n=1 Tax=Metopolophium dirhodum TaxID=44670 RepID=UPI00298FED98|nr:uncharacterized protein LOC132936738 [Metopolophium dirhodum]
MPLKCFVPGCNSGLPKQNKIYKQQGVKLPSVFHPISNMIDTWNLKIPRADRLLTKKDGVCELHFAPEDIISYRIFEDAAGNEIKHQLKRVSLNANAIPCIFLNLPSYFNKNIKKRKPPMERSIVPNNRKKNKPSDLNPVNEIINNPELVTDVVIPHCSLIFLSSSTLMVNVGEKVVERQVTQSEKHLPETQRVRSADSVLNLILL